MRGIQRSSSCALVAATLALLATPEASEAYNYKKEIRILATQVSGSSDLVDFPVLISLTDPDLAANAQPTGDDIIFRQGGCAFTQLDHEIEYFDSGTGTIIAWVRVPFLSASVDTIIEMYYGDATIVGSQEKVAGVWDASYKGVWHLREDPSGAAPQMADSTVENNDGTSAGGMTSTDLVSARIDGGIAFDGIDDVIDAGDQPEFELPVYSWSMWLRANAAPIVGFGNSQPIWNAPTQFNFSWSHNLLAFSQAAQHRDASAWQAARIVTPLTGGTWYYISASYDGANIRVYLNGNLEATQAAGTPIVNPGVLSIGDSGMGVDAFPGTLDEVRVSNVARSRDWFKTSFNNQNTPSSFYIVGPETAASSCGGTYRSIGTKAGVLYSTGTATIAAGSNVVTFSGATLPANVGIGDELRIGVETFFILSRVSDTQVTVHNAAAIAHPGEACTIARAYNTLQEWEDDREGDLVASDRNEVGVAYNDGVFNAGATIEGSTTDPTHFMTLTVARPHRHRGVAGTGARIDGLGGPLGEIRVSDDHTVVEWLELANTVAGDGVRVEDASNVLLSHLILHDNTRGIRLQGGGGNSFTVRNSVIYDNANQGIQGDEVTDTITVENCTLFANGGAGIDGSSGTNFVVTNTISIFHPTFDFTLPTATESNNISSDSSASGPGSLLNRSPTDNPSPGAGDWVVFQSLAPGVKDFHLVPSPENDAIDAAADLSSTFQRDIDFGLRQTPWDVGADDALASGRVSISSANDQSFFVGSVALPAATITITDDALPTIQATNDIRIRIPAGFPMQWDPALTTLVITGSGSGKVGNIVKAFEDGGRTLVLDVTNDFAPGDQIDIAGAQFFNFTNPAPIHFLELEVGNDDIVSDTDDRTITVVAGATPHLSSQFDQVFTAGGPDTPAAVLYVTDGAAPEITSAIGFTIRIPATFNMAWDTLLTSVSIGGSASSKVSSTVSYPDNKTLLVNVTADFAAGEFVSISGLEFRSFTGPSAIDNLELRVNFNTYDDDKTIEITGVSDVPFFTATATGVPSEVVLEWIAPFAGLCTGIEIYARDDGFPPTDPGDALARQVGGIFPCTPAGGKFSTTDSIVVDGTPTGYAAFVDTGATYTAGKKLVARSFDESGTNLRWAYSTGAASMASPGLRFFGPTTFVYAVSNDSILHAMQGSFGPTSGQWPAGWKPFLLGAPAQNRPPVLSIPIGPLANGAVLLGSQDGQVYAVDVVDGSLGWKTPIASMVQAAPAGHFKAFLGSAYDRILVGTRNSSANALVGLDLSGNVQWSFTNTSGAQNGDDSDLGIISGGVAIDYANGRAYFATRKDIGPNPSSDTLWCLSFTDTTVTRVWSANVGNVDGSPIFYNDTVYVGNNSGTVHAYAAAGGQNWSYPLGDGPIKGFIFPEFDTNNLLLSTNTHLWSLSDDGGSASENWNVPAAIVPSPSTPLFAPGTTDVLVGSSNGRLYQIDVATGSIVKSVVLGDGSGAVGAPSFDVRSSMIYVGTDQGVIYGVFYPLP